MGEFNLHALMRFTASLASICVGLEKRKPRNPDERVHASVRKRFQAFADEGLEICGTLELTATRDQLIRVRAILDRPEVTYDSICTGVTDLVHRLYDDASRTLVIHVPQRRAAYYNNNSLFGETVVNAFPDATDDLREAGKCLAFGRATASVMHLMRAIEFVLEKVASSLGVTYSHNGWGPLLTALRTAIDAKYPRHGGATQRQQYLNFIDRIGAVKDAIRNPSMHGVAHHDIDEAEDIFRAARALMKTASRL